MSTSFHGRRGLGTLDFEMLYLPFKLLANKDFVLF